MKPAHPRLTPAEGFSSFPNSIWERGAETASSPGGRGLLRKLHRRWVSGGYLLNCRPQVRRLPSTSAFTLLEMMMVLLIITIMAGLSMPAIQSAFTEQGIRKDSHQLALMVKTAMIQSEEQHRNYVIDLTSTSMALHPEGQAAADADAAVTADDTDADSTANSAQVDVELTTTLDPPNQLLTPDPQKADSWIAMPDATEWVFQPGELCPATRVRVKRGEAWLEMSFTALTGNVENEADYLP